MSGKKIRNSIFLFSATLALGTCGDDGGNSGRSDPADTRNPIDAAGPSTDAGSLDAGNDTRFAATWPLIGGCLAGDQVELDISSTFDGRTFIKRFPCSAGTGTFDPVGAGTFDILLRVIDNDLPNLTDAGVDPDAGAIPPAPGPLVAESDLIDGIASVANTDIPVLFEFPSNTASIATSWRFQAEGQAETCAEASVVSVDLEYELVGGAGVRTVRHSCTVLANDSGDLATGLYLVRAVGVDGAYAVVREEVETTLPLLVGNRELTTTFGFVAPTP